MLHIRDRALEKKRLAGEAAATPAWSPAVQQFHDDMVAKVLGDEAVPSAHTDTPPALEPLDGTRVDADPATDPSFPPVRAFTRVSVTGEPQPPTATAPVPCARPSIIELAADADDVDGIETVTLGPATQPPTDPHPPSKSAW